MFDKFGEIICKERAREIIKAYCGGVSYNCI